MRKVIAMFARFLYAAIVFVFVLIFNLHYSQAAGGIEVTPFDGFDGVSLVNTAKTPISVSIRDDAKKLEIAGSEYPTKVLVYLPGYLGDQKNQDYIISFVLPKWNAWKKTHGKSTLVVCSRFPAWCRIFPADEVKDLTSVYQTELNSVVKTRFFEGIGTVLAQVNKDLTDRDQAVKDRLASELVAKNAAKEAEADRLDQIEKELASARSVLSSRIEKLRNFMEEVHEYSMESYSTTVKLVEDSSKVISGTDLVSLYRTADSLGTFMEVLEQSVQNQKKAANMMILKVVVYVGLILLLGRILFRLYRTHIRKWQVKEHEKALRMSSASSILKTLPWAEFDDLERSLLIANGQASLDKNKTFLVVQGFKIRASAFRATDVMSLAFDMEVFSKDVTSFCSDWQEYRSRLKTIGEINITQTIVDRVTIYRQSLQHLPDYSSLVYFLQQHPLFVDYIGKMNRLVAEKKADPESFYLNLQALEFLVQSFEGQFVEFLEKLRRVKALDGRILLHKDLGSAEIYLTPLHVPATWFSLAAECYGNLLLGSTHGILKIEQGLSLLTECIKLREKGIAIAQNLHRVEENVVQKNTSLESRIRGLSSDKGELASWASGVLLLYHSKVQAACHSREFLVAETLLDEAEEFYKIFIALQG